MSEAKDGEFPSARARSGPPMTGRLWYGVSTPITSNISRELIRSIKFPLLDQTRFWSEYPQQPDAFRALVKKPGISVSIHLDHASERRVAEPSEGDEGSGGMDLEASLPDPPNGYYWVSDNGGLRMDNSKTFRLWSQGLGYMPRAE
jgi:hypothetical protein